MSVPETKISEAPPSSAKEELEDLPDETVKVAKALPKERVQAEESAPEEDSIEENLTGEESTEEESTEDSELPEVDSFDEYQVLCRLGETEHTFLWLVHQQSVDREAMVEELKHNSELSHDDFLEDIRAKASVEHPMLSTIYDADPDNFWAAHELLPGKTFQELLDSGKKLHPAALVESLRKLCRANKYYDRKGIKTDPITLDSIYYEPNGVVIQQRNLAIAGARDEEESQRDIAILGEEFVSLLARRKKGANRCLHLFAWMRGEIENEDKDTEETVRNWETLESYCIHIELQLHEKAMAAIPPTSAVYHQRKRKRKLWMLLVFLCALLAVGGWLYWYLSKA